MADQLRNPSTGPGQAEAGGAHEPIAVVGMACKFPGAPDLASFWRLLETGGNAITEGVPGSGVGRIGEFYPESARDNPACRFAALVDDIDLFDAEFFRISPVEAQLLDPQQRMVLETTWQALEDALVDPERLRGSRTGVYVGISNNDYRTISLDANQPTEPAASLYTVAGTSFNTAAGRVAYALGLEGPAMAVDTACSSSLFALHQAMTSLQRKEADLMVVGGVQAIFLGRLTQLRANARMLSPDGQCKAFDASANGFVRGEGCGMVVVKRLSDAIADGDRIWGVVRGSAVNQDGASAGLTVPNATAQSKVIEDALLQAGIEPNEVDYLEAHGTGTEVGDPIELNAAVDVYGQGRDAERPLLVGSVKTNVGHLEPAAGVAGLMKVLLSMHRGMIPKHLHFNTPNPRVDWDNIPVRITSEVTAWPEVGERPHRAGISSYGWSGTNVHVVVEASPHTVTAPNAAPAPVDTVGMPQPAGPALPVAGDAGARRPARLLPLAGKNDDALRDLARSYLGWLDRQSGEAFASGLAGDAELSDMAWSASVARSHFAFRKGLVFRDTQSLRDGLRGIVDPDDDATAQQATKVAFAYTGQGNQWAGMGEGLHASEPVFRAVLDRCDALIKAERGVSLLDVMFGRAADGNDLDEPRWTQPAIYALEAGLTALWKSVGIEPSVVVGHSLGEIAAAQAAGVFSLEDGLRFASARGRLLGALPRAGAMAAVFAAAPQVEEAVAEWNAAHLDADVVIGVDNGTHQVVSGPAEEINAFVDKLEAANVNVRRLRPSPAYHSPLVEPALDDLEAVFADIDVSPAAISLLSNLTGAPITADDRLDGAYWRRHARSPVAFRSSVETLAELGVDAVIEMGPHSVLGPLVSLNWPQRPGIVAAPVVLQSVLRPSFDGSEPERADAYVRAVAGAYEAGLPVDLASLFTGEERRKISVPGYPFQRRRYWVTATQRRRQGDAHPLLGVKHESPRGEVMYETEMFPSDPAWLQDHRVYGRVVMPGAVYGAMAASVPLAEGGGASTVEELQLHNPLVYPEYDANGDDPEPGRRVQVVIDGGKGPQPRHFEVYSKGKADEAWTLHAEGQLSPAGGQARQGERVQLEALTEGLEPQDIAAYYRAKAGTGIDFGPSFRTVESLWCEGLEALGEIALQGSSEGMTDGIHPLLLDGCFQVLSATRTFSGIGGDATYLPFAWERLWLNGPLPERLVCHTQLRESVTDGGGDAPASVPETLTGDLWLYSTEGLVLGGLTGFTLKRATRSALLSASEGLQDLLYEVVWRERPLTGSIKPADFLESPTEIASRVAIFARYLEGEGVDPFDRNALLDDLERLSWAYALQTLEGLGWERRAGDVVVPEDIREGLGVLPEHEKLFRRLFDLLARAGVAEETGEGFSIVVAPGDPKPEALPADPEAFAEWMYATYPHGEVEIGLIKRSGGALGKALAGEVDPLTLLFSSGDPTPADLYLRAPVAKGANKMLADAIAVMLDRMPPGRTLRVIEVGAGTGSATASVLPELPAGQFEYTYTDISAGFFAEAEERFGGGPIDYRVLDIERDPVEQGFPAHGYDLLIASNVLHATRYLEETLAHCLRLLSPSGQLVALENLRGQGWLDLTFGQLDGWWRYADAYRPRHALAGPVVWHRALTDAGFKDAVVLGPEAIESTGMLDRGVMVAQGPAEVKEPAGAWVLVGDDGSVAEQLAEELAARNQSVVLAYEDGRGSTAGGRDGVVRATVEPERRESWEALLGTLPAGVPFNGVVHLLGLDGQGIRATTPEFAEATRRTGTSALALVQGLLDADAAPEKGLWLVTRGAQTLDHEPLGEPSGAMLWGFGKVVAREAKHLNARMLDLEAGARLSVGAVADELLHPDAETHIAYRRGARQTARLTRAGSETERLTLPEDSPWLLSPDEDGDLGRIKVDPLPSRELGPKEIRVAVEAAGLNFWDVFRGLGLIQEGQFGGELCGRVIEAGAEVTNVAVGDRVVGLAIGAFSSEAITRAEMVTAAPQGVPLASLATVPVVFASAALSYELSGLHPGDRVLIHAGAGGVGLAAIQLAQAAGAEVFATASAPKQAYLRSLGVEHVFDSRQTAFGREVLEATNGEGVTIVLNSLTGEGFIEASLECLAQGGRFVEMARVGIYSEEEMAEARPDVAYSILRLDALKEDDPSHLGDVLGDVMDRIGTGELGPLVHSRWSVADAGSAMKFMRAARHIGKIVLATSAIEGGRLRGDRSYLVTGGLGGIGCAVAEWLAERGAGAIVLNGRRAPDPAAEETIAALRERGYRVEVELADVTDADAVDAMLARIDATMPPLAGVIHSVGVLSDGALTNQTWEKFKTVLWPKMMGAWQLHRATLDRDLDLFVLFSSLAGVTGNPGQSNHAAANAFLDQLAGHRRALGLPGQTIAWGAWAGLGEAEEQRERIERQLASSGVGWVTPQQGIRVLDSLVRQDVTTATAAAVDWPTYKENLGDEMPSFLESLLATGSDDAAEGARQTAEDLLTTLGETPSPDREGLLVTFLQGELRAVLRSPTAPPPAVGFFDLGMDSLMAVELRNRLNRALAGEYTTSNTVVFDYPTVAALAAFLAAELEPVLGSGAAAAPAAAPAPRQRRPQAPAKTEEDAIAIVGMACRFPGAPDLEAFWRLLAAGEDAVTDGRPDEGPWEGAVGDPAGDELILRHGGFVEGLDRFDHQFFRIQPLDARMMDPRQRMLLETSWHAFEDAGMDPERLRGTRTGVYTGVGGSDYRDIIASRGQDEGYLGTTGSVAAGRLAFAFGLEGQTMPFDLACASSLAAVHQASTALQRGEVDLALVGGVSAVLSTSVTRFLRSLGMVSGTGRGRPFDAAGDGYVRGEGCGMVVLKRLSEAQADGDRIWAVVRGSAVNQNGSSAGLTVPNGPAQERVMREALARAGVEPGMVDYLEAHGTGTDLGDTIEINAIASAYGQGGERERPLLLGSVKSNIGHLEWASGIAGLIKTTLAMHHGVVPQHLHFHDPNPNVDWESLPVQVTSETAEWPSHPERAPLAGVHSYGLSGANAHVVLEGHAASDNGSGPSAPERQPVGPLQRAAIDLRAPFDTLALPERTPTEAKARVLPLSAKSTEALRELAGQYLGWIEGKADEPSLEELADMAWTAGTGRSHFTHRSAVAFRDTAELKTGLRALIDAQEGPESSASSGASRVAFVYTGGLGEWAGAAKELYRTEPVVRALLDRCDEVLRQERGVSLLDTALGRDDAGSAGAVAVERAAVYALQAAVTALWQSVGVRPSAVLGEGAGELAAALAAGVFSLEDGLRLAAALTGPDAALPRVDLSPPTVTVVSGVTGQALQPNEATDNAHWRKLAGGAAAFETGMEALTGTGADLVIEIGPSSGQGASTAPNGAEGAESAQRIVTLDGGTGFPAAVARAYEAGVSVSFAGLFAGEERRKVGLPSYPFQRRSFWVQPARPRT